jgi:hypothetical protein
MHRFHGPYGQYGNTVTESFEFTPDAKRVRHFLYEYFLEHCRAPTLLTIVEQLGLDQDQTWDALHQLERANFVVFVPGTEDILKVPPFSAAPTRHTVIAEDGRTWYAGCAGEACSVNGMLPGATVTIKAMCPECWGPLVFTVRDREYVSLDLPEAVIHIGTHPDDFPKDWIVTCDSINFFCSPEHVAIWEAAVPERKGVMFPIDKGLQWSSFSAQVRYWDYDRPSNTMTTAPMVAGLKNLGADVSAWE